MAKVLHLIRHGESKANHKSVYQGQGHDTALTAKGRRQSAAAAKIIKLAKADKIYTSPLTRTLETAEIINNQLKLKIVKDRKLMEINHGSWEGKTPDQFNQQEQQMLRLWRRNPVGVKMIDGEEISDVVNRCKAFIKSLKEGRYLVVTHDLVIRVLVSLAIHHQYKYLWKYTLDNGGITTVSFKPYRLVSLNQNFHLNKIQSRLNRQAL